MISQFDDGLEIISASKDIIELRDQLLDLLKAAGITLGKWSANDAKILHDVIDSKVMEIVIGADEIISTLGIKWLPLQDHFTLRFLQSQRDDVTTKRFILSSTEKLFDLLGWIAPVITIPKVIMQDLWLEKFDWIQPVSPDLQARWMALFDSLTGLNAITVSRWIGISTGGEWHLHGE